RANAAVVQFGREDVALVRRMRVPADRWGFMVPLTVPGSARWNGCAIHGGEIVVCAPGSGGYAFDPSGMGFAVVSMPESRVPVPLDVLRTTVAAGESAVVRPVACRASALRAELLALDAAACAAGVIADGPSRFQRVALHLARCVSPASPSIPNA